MSDLEDADIDTWLAHSAARTGNGAIIEEGRRIVRALREQNAALVANVAHIENQRLLRHRAWLESRAGVAALEHSLEMARLDAANAIRQREIVQEQNAALVTALRNQGLLQNTFHGTVWHIHDCPASFDFAECHYRCREARKAFALADTEPYVSQETRRDTEVYE